jgi:hypothetical protein
MGDASSYSVASSREIQRNPILFTDCLVALPGSVGTYPWFVSAIGSGQLLAPSAGLVTVNHPGVIKLISTGANGGMMIWTDPDSRLISGGECMEVILNIVSLATVTMRIGFHDSITNPSEPVDGCYFVINNLGQAVGRTANNSVFTTSPIIATLSLSIWYRLLVTVNPTKTAVDFYIYNDSGTLLGTQQITTNIPGTSRLMTSAIEVAKSGTGTTHIVHIDWIAMWYEGKSLTRGKTYYG